MHSKITRRALLGIAAMWLITGCNENEDVVGTGDGGFALDPASAALNMWTYGERAPLFITVQGGAPPFTWTQSEATLGDLAGNDDPYARRVIYTAADGQEGVNRIGIRDHNGWEAHATIIQDTLSVTLAGADPSSPNVKTLTTKDEDVLITVGGGILPLSWGLSNPALGALTPTPARDTWYTRDGIVDGVNLIEVTDAQGLTATATLLQD